MHQSPESLAPWIEAQFQAWAARITDPASTRIAPGSSLDLDQARDLPGGRNPVQVVWRAMATAGEHAAAAGQLIIASGGGIPTKPFLTLARTTMIGAAKVLYLLEPDDSEERRIRALRLLRTESKDVTRLIKVWENETTVPVDPELRLVADELQAESEAALVQMGEKAGSEMGDAALLMAVAPHLSDGPANPLARVMESWNLSSGNAHARSWAWDVGLEDDAPVNQFVRVWILPVDLMDHAWELWNLRRAAQQGAH